MGKLVNKIMNSEIVYRIWEKPQERLLYSQFQILHELQLQRIRKKVEHGDKIRVVFLVMQAAKFGFESIIEEMKKTDLFEPIVFVASHNDTRFREDEFFLELAKKDFEEVKKMGYTTYFAYDNEGRPQPLWGISPDIVVYNELTNAGYYKNYIVNREFLTCYIGYGTITSNRFKKIFRTYQRNCSWKIFLENRYVYEQYHRYSAIGGMNAVLTGYPKLDEYKKQEDIKHTRKLVIYAPHWTINDKEGYQLNFSTFPIYYKKVLQMVKENPEIDFVFKPHPRLGIRIKELEKEKKPFMTYSQYSEYIKEWERLENGSIYSGGSYIGLFKRSACMIMDSGSFISEYLPSGNPCIYLLNPKKKKSFGDYNEFAKRILDTYYCCSDWESVEKRFRNIIYHGIDEKKPERIEMEKELINIGTAGAHIVQYILNEITGA